MQNNAKLRLIEARKKLGYTQENMSSELDMDVSSYNRRENGQIRISNKEWQKMSNILKVSLEEIYEPDEGMIMIFNDNSPGCGNGNGNIITNYTLPQSVLDSQKKYIEKLEEENRILKEQNRLLNNHDT